MRKIRIGKDIDLRWHVEVPEGSELLSDMDLTLYMSGPQGMHVLIENATIGADTIEFTLRGTLFSQLGDYSLTCWKNKGEQGQTVLDAIRAFTLVKSTEQEADYKECGCNELTLATVDLRTQLEIDLRGYFNDPAIIERITDLESRVEVLEHEDPPTPPTPTPTYSVTRNLTGVSSSNATSSVTEGSSYTTTLSLASGYQNMSVTVTMGGTNITSSALNGNVVTIASVTGNVVITATATQIPVVTEYVYAGSVRNSTSDPVSINQFTAGASSTTKTVNYTPTETVNTIIAVCPSTMNLTSCVKHGEIEDDITDYMLASVSNVTYENKQCKMYQFKYGSSIKNNAFTITFN